LPGRVSTFHLMPNFIDEMDFLAYFNGKRLLDITMWIICCGTYSSVVALILYFLCSLFSFLLKQVDTLSELQRLYDELVESADVCQLDRNSEKPVR